MNRGVSLVILIARDGFLLISRMTLIVSSYKARIARISPLYPVRYGDQATEKTIVLNKSFQALSGY